MLNIEAWATAYFESLAKNDLFRAINAASFLQVPVFMRYATAFVAQKIEGMTIPKMRGYLNTKINYTEEEWDQLLSESVFRSIMTRDGARKTE